MYEKKQKTVETYDHVDYECMQVYNDIFGTKRGFYSLESGGVIVHNLDIGKDFFDRCQRSQECGRNLFVEEWREWEGYEEGCLY